MIRTLLAHSKRLLEPRAVAGISHRPIPDPRTLAPITIHDIRRDTHFRNYPNLPVGLTNRLYPSPKLPVGLANPLYPYLFLRPDNKFILKEDVRWTRTENGPKKSNPSQVIFNLIDMIKCVDLNELKDAPPAAFWTAAALSGSQLAIPLLEMFGGYSPVMTFLQLNAAAITLGFFGGMKWGLSVYNDSQPATTWETMRWGLVPPGLAVTGLLLPYPLGFTVLGCGMMTSLYLDLKACVYPPWACAMAVVISFSTLIGLIFAMMGYVLFHNSLMRKRERDSRHKEPEEDLSNNDDNNGNDDKKPPKAP